ncbi:serine/arginine repetitive matrix protein 1-like [Littorina saxatilis]|uniref:serine/arginine repetitive matrix protein 1-like n=1 Tax=Littorina saxatilis TaxID=31220 RepID=UPI0038B57366
MKISQEKGERKSLLLQKKQPRFGNNSAKDEAATQEEETHGDEDAFTPTQMEEFRRLANSRASTRSVSRANMLSTTQIPRPLTSASLRASSRAGATRAETPHIFPALRERPLTSMSKGRRESRVGSAATVVGNRQTLASAANMYGGQDQEYDGVMDPTADFSANRRMRMNPRAFSRLSSASRIKVKVMDKTGEFVMKPVSGKPGVVSINGSQDKDDNDHPIMDSKDKMALVKMTTTFKSPTLSSELKTNNLVAIQKSLLGKETKRMTVGEVMAKSRDRRARLFRVQMSLGRQDDLDVPGEDRRRPLTRTASAGERSLERGGPSRLGMGPPRSVVEINTQQRMESPSRLRRSEEDAIRSRAKTAPATRPQGRSTSTPTPAADRPAESTLGVPRRPALRSQSPNPRPAMRRGPTPSAHPKLSVVQLELQDSAKDKAKPHPPHAPRPPHAATPVTPKSARTSAQHRPPCPPRALFPVSAKSLASAGKARPYSVKFGNEKRKAEAKLETAEKECSVHIKYIHTLRDSAAVVRRWKELDRDSEEKLNKWRMRMSFAATRRGNLGKVLSRV